MTFHMEQETREVQAPQWRPSIVKEKKKADPRLKLNFYHAKQYASSSSLPPSSLCQANSKANLGFWRKVLTHKIDGYSWDSKKEIAPALTQEEADEIRKQEILLAIPHLSNTNI